MKTEPYDDSEEQIDRNANALRRQLLSGLREQRERDERAEKVFSGILLTFFVALVIALASLFFL